MLYKMATLWVNMPATDIIHPQCNTLFMGVKIRKTCDSKLHDNPDSFSEKTFIDGFKEEISNKYIIIMTV